MSFENSWLTGQPKSSDKHLSLGFFKRQSKDYSSSYLQTAIKDYRLNSSTNKNLSNILNGISIVVTKMIIVRNFFKRLFKKTFSLIFVRKILSYFFELIFKRQTLSFEFVKRQPKPNILIMSFEILSNKRIHSNDKKI